MGEWLYRSHFLDLRSEWSASRLSRVTPGTHWIGGLVDPRAGLDKGNFFDPTGTLTPTSLVVQPVTSRYTDCATPAPAEQNKEIYSEPRAGNPSNCYVRIRRVAGRIYKNGKYEMISLGGCYLHSLSQNIVFIS
jgi:hypothetical protein